MNNIYIDGKRSFPKCLADLGENFAFQGKGKENMAGVGDTYVAEYPTVTDCFLYKGKIIGQVIVADTLKNYGISSEIIFFNLPSWSFWDPTEDEGLSLLGIYGFRIGESCTKSDIRVFLEKKQKKQNYGYIMN